MTIKEAIDFYSVVAACVISTGTIIGTSIYLLRQAIKISKKLDSLVVLEGKVDKIIKEQDEQGLIVRVSETQTLLDKTKELEKELDLSKEKLNVRNELLHQPLYECDANGNLCFANEALIELIGAKNVESFYGRGWMNYIEEPYRTRIEDDYNRDIKYNKSYKYRYPIASDTKRFYIDNVGKVYRDSSGEIQFILGTIRIAA